MNPPVLTLLLLALLASPSPAAVVEGVVRNPFGKPIEKAYVQDLESNRGAFTDPGGRFQLSPQSFPLRLEVIHPNYENKTIVIRSQPAQPLEMVLTPKPMMNEMVVVSANLPAGGFSPVGTAATAIAPESPPLPPTTLTELVEAVPGVAENGQGGIFQVYSVRGVSKHRILTTISGVRLTTERRAGVSASFLDPLLMESVDLQRGPSSSYYGSGALGGVVQVVPSQFERFELRTGYESQGSENFQFAGWGNQNWSVGFARRDADNARAADGSEINSHFTQYSSVVESKWTSGDNDFSVTLIPTLSRDIGKANTDYPSKPTNYPEEKHLIANFEVRSQKQWQLQAFIHPHDLHTEAIEGSERADVFNDTFDFGLAFNKQMRVGNSRFARFGIDYFARRSVDSRERASSLEDRSNLAPREELRSLEDAQDDEIGLYGLINLRLGRATIETGGRFSWFHQKNAELPSIRRSGWNGFAGIAVPLGLGLELNGGLGTGFRNPNLSERFYTGTTGRGKVIGNPLLDPERSFNLDAGLRWYGPNVFLAAYLFRNRIDNYVERIEMEPDLLSYLNLPAGTVKGLEWEGVVQPAGVWQVYGRGHFITGSDQSGHPLADIPVDRLTLGTSFKMAKWRYGTELQLRRGKSLPGSGEKPIDAAQLLSAFLRYNVSSNFQLSFSASNLLNELYFNSADRKVSFAPGRGISLALVWFPE